MDVRTLRYVDFEQLRELLRKEGVPAAVIRERLRVRHPVWWDSSSDNGVAVPKKVSPLSRFVRRKGLVAVALVKPDLLIRANGTYVHLDNPLSAEGDTTAAMHGFTGRNPILVRRLVEAFPLLQEVEIPTEVPVQVAKVVIEVYGWENYAKTLADFW